MSFSELNERTDVENLNRPLVGYRKMTGDAVAGYLVMASAGRKPASEAKLLTCNFDISDGPISLRIIPHFVQLFRSWSDNRS